MSKCLAVHLTSNMIDLVNIHYKNHTKNNKTVRLSSAVRELLKHSLEKMSIEEGEEMQFSFEFKTDQTGIHSVMLLIPPEINNKLEEICKYVPLSKKKLAEYLIQLEITALEKEAEQ